MRYYLILSILLFTVSVSFTQTLFECNWNNGIGDLCPALDGGAGWNDITRDFTGVSDPDMQGANCTFHYTSAGHLEIFPGGPNGQNCAGIWVNGTTGVSFFEHPGIIRTTDTYTFIRVYVRVRNLSGGGGFYHFFEDHHNASNWYINCNGSNSNNWTFTSWSNAQYSYPYGGGRLFEYENCPVDEWIRIEIKIHWLNNPHTGSSEQTHTYYRIYDNDNNLIADNDNIHDSDVHSLTLTRHYANGNYMLWAQATANNRGIKIGNNGPASNSRVGRYIDVAALKITNGPGENDWIGPINGDDPPSKVQGINVNP